MKMQGGLGAFVSLGAPEGALRPYLGRSAEPGGFSLTWSAGGCFSSSPRAEGSARSLFPSISSELKVSPQAHFQFHGALRLMNFLSALPRKAFRMLNQESRCTRRPGASAITLHTRSTTEYRVIRGTLQGQPDRSF